MSLINTATGRNYMANHVAAPQILQGTPNFNVEVSEGMNPPGDFYPAHYLPTVISENRIAGSFYVLMPGKVVSLDTNKRLVGSGLALDLDAFSTAYAGDGGNAAAKLAAGQAVATYKYKSDDVAAGFTDANGGIVAVDDFVAEAMHTAGVGTTADPVGYIRYSSLMAPGTDPNDPSTFWKHAYDTGGARAFSRCGYIQVPIVEINTRSEKIQLSRPDVRIALWPDTTPFVFKKAGVSKVVVHKPSVQAFTAANAEGTPDQYAVIGRTVFFNTAPDTDTWTIEYVPRADLPFACLTSNQAGTITEANQYGLANFIGKKVTYDIASNYAIWNNQKMADTTTARMKIGQILDVKVGKSSDLALVRTYYRDFGLWQEGPGSATDGRNAILSIANAPKYIARIATRFDIP
jgi:hypothetical protein